MMRGHDSRSYLGPKTVTGGTKLCDAVDILHGLDGSLDDGSHGFRRVGVLAAGSLCPPSLKVKVGGSVELECIPVKLVDDHAKVSVGGKLVRHEFAVLPDADDIGDEQDSRARVSLARVRRCNVGVPFFSYLDHLPCRLTTERIEVSHGWLHGRKCTMAGSSMNGRRGNGIRSSPVFDSDGAALRRAICRHVEFVMAYSVFRIWNWYEVDFGDQGLGARELALGHKEEEMDGWPA
jgi:hypothetical protein